MGLGILPSISLGKTSVFSMALSTALSQSAFPLEFIILYFEIAPEDVIVNSISDSEFPSKLPENEMFGLILPMIRFE
jgi:hypothetical protein